MTWKAERTSMNMGRKKATAYQPARSINVGSEVTARSLHGHQITPAM
jgi:hypothetical protein